MAVVSLQFGEKSYFELSARLLAQYCSKHGYELAIGDGGLNEGRDRRWGKLALVAEALRSFDLVLYLDADCVVNQETPLAELLPLLGACDMLLGRDSHWNANTGAMLFRPESRDIVTAWDAVSTQHPETAHTWPVDELAFNRHVLPAFGERIACPRRVVGTLTDFVQGPFVRHFMNGDESSKMASMARAAGE